MKWVKYVGGCLLDFPEFWTFQLFSIFLCCLYLKFVSFREFENILKIRKTPRKSQKQQLLLFTDSPLHLDKPLNLPPSLLKSRNHLNQKNAKRVRKANVKRIIKSPMSERGSEKKNYGNHSNQVVLTFWHTLTTHFKFLSFTRLFSSLFRSLLFNEAK